MRSALLVVASLAAVVAVVLLLGGLLPAPSQPTAAERVEALSREMRCPDCQSLSVAESRTAAAAAIRAEIEQQVAAGRSDEQVRAYFTDRYGEWILLAPPDPLVWWPPVLAVMAGIIGLAAWFGLARRRAPAPEPPAAVDDTQRSRISDELEVLDG